MVRFSLLLNFSWTHLVTLILVGFEFLFVREFSRVVLKELVELLHLISKQVCRSTLDGGIDSGTVQGCQQFHAHAKNFLREIGPLELRLKQCLFCVLFLLLHL